MLPGAARCNLSVWIPPVIFFFFLGFYLNLYYQPGIWNNSPFRIYFPTTSRARSEKKNKHKNGFVSSFLFTQLGYFCCSFLSFHTGNHFLIPTSFRMLHKNNVPLLPFFFFPFLLYQIHKKKVCEIQWFYKAFVSVERTWDVKCTNIQSIRDVNWSRACPKDKVSTSVRFFEFFFELFSIGIRIKFSKANF